MLFLLIICFWITFTVNICEACESSNLEILHILEMNPVVISYSALISALKIACPTKHFLFSSSTAYRNLKIQHNLLSIFECYGNVLYLPSFERFYSDSPFSHLLFSDSHHLHFFSLVLCISLSFTTYSSFLLSCSSSSQKKVGSSQRKKKNEAKTVGFSGFPIFKFCAELRSTFFEKTALEYLLGGVTENSL